MLRTALRYIQVWGREARPRGGRATDTAPASCAPRLPSAAPPSLPHRLPRPPPRGRRAHGPADVNGAPRPGGGGGPARVRGGARWWRSAPLPRQAAPRSPAVGTVPAAQCRLGPRPCLTACRALVPRRVGRAWGGRRLHRARPQCLGGNRFQPETITGAGGEAGGWAWLVPQGGALETPPPPPRPGPRVVTQTDQDRCSKRMEVPPPDFGG